MPKRNRAPCKVEGFAQSTERIAGGPCDTLMGMNSQTATGKGAVLKETVKELENETDTIAKPMNDEKIQQLKSAVELSPDNPVLLQMYLEALQEACMWQEAETVCKQLANTDPGYQLEYARLLYKNNKISQGILLLEHHIEQGMQDAEAYKWLILFYNKENNQTAAGRLYRALNALHPDYRDDELDELFKATEDESCEEDERVSLLVEEKPAAPIIPLEKPNVSFKDVGGMKSVKEDISMKIINPIKHADLFKQYGKKIGGGILLYGPPGCGKTHIARATAGEIDSAFISVGINDVLDMYLGQSERQLHDIFEYARKNTPCVIFFDEVDALGANRTDMKNSAGKNVINQFLQEMDGLQAENDGILVLGATNAPWHIDAAFKRPGRFDRIIFIPPPDEEARKEILEIQLKDKPAMDLDSAKIARNTKDFTGADMKALVDVVIEEKLKTIIETGKETPIKTRDFLSAIKRIKPSCKVWFETAKNYAVYSNQSGQYDDILTYLNIK
ncbi:AAA family ATPase [Carboxylicivirga taeanensis]|uniref:ATP-binding protein n=1 Tax=Carboxylicivirga taeanensis TaxID=1416875 RepID=UPI003F6E0E07